MRPRPPLLSAVASLRAARSPRAMNVDQARDLMHAWVASEALRTHMECVAACMRAYAERRAPDDVARWVVAGLLHDLDYERHPTLEEHPFVGVRHLEALGVDAAIREAILGHGDHTNTPRTSDMAKVLYAVDELAGFLVACVKVRPDGIASLGAKSVKKKLKDRSFAAAVSREDIARGVAELGVDLTEHVEFCIEALRRDAARLGLDGGEATDAPPDATADAPTSSGAPPPAEQAGG